MRVLNFYKVRVFRNVACMLFVLMFLTASTDVMAWQRNVSRTGPSGQSAMRNITATRSGSGYNRSTTFNGPQGNSATRETSASRTESGVNRSTTTTGPQGNTMTREANSQWNPETKTWTKSSNTTGSGGQAATRETSVTRTESGINRSTSTTGPQGNTVTRDANGQWDPETKTWSKNVIVETAP